MFTIVKHRRKSFRSAGSSGTDFPTTNLVAFYKLDESSGDALDYSGNAEPLPTTEQ